MNKKTTFFIILYCLLFSCKEEELKNLDFRQEMRNFVIKISEFSKNVDSDFVVIPQNGIELISNSEENIENLNTEYLEAIDGNGQEDLLYGYDEDDRETPEDVTEYLKNYLNLSKEEENLILVTDYCITNSKMLNSYVENNLSGYVSFSADSRELNDIPFYPDPIFYENNTEIDSLKKVKNFLYLINPENYSTKSDFIDAVASTNYDLIIMDLFFNDNSAFTSDEINQLKTKANGAKRMVVCYMSIGEAEEYRFYWQSEWNKEKPEWLEKENPDWEGNYKVRYWYDDWQKIIISNENSYVNLIIEAGFDGVYLDIIDAFEYFEQEY